MTGKLDPVAGARRSALRHAPEALESLIRCIREPDAKRATWATRNRAASLLLQAGGLIRPPEVPPAVPEPRGDE